MNPTLVSIDFGNSYTKVGIRPDLGKRSVAAADPGLVFDDELYVCIPTVAARAVRKGRERWLYGTDVMRLGEGTRGVEIFRNWKPDFFDGLETSLAASTDSGDRMDDAEWVKMRDELGLTDDQRDAFEGLRRQAAGEEATVSATQVGEGFFRWLRGFLEPICAKKGVDLDSAVARITLPAFGALTKAEDDLKGILTAAGFTTDSLSPCLPEPVANAIGVFAEGRNVTWRPNGGRKVRPHFGHMFGETRFFTAVRERALNLGKRSDYWVLVADLGGYTLDFAMVGFDVDRLEVSVQGMVQGKRRLATYSQPIGVSALDRRIAALLDGDKREIFDEVLDAIDQRRLEAFHRNVYQRRSPYVLRGGYALNQEPDEVQRFDACVEQFADDVADYAEAFMEVEQYDRIDDLILTGGGMNIPAVRDGLRKRLGRFDVQGTYVPAAFDEADLLSEEVERVPPMLVRAATALGGSSIYFDFRPQNET